MKKINKIKIKINGKFIKIQDKITLLSLVKKIKVPIKKVAIELNQVVINKNSLSRIKIKKNDSARREDTFSIKEYEKLYKCMKKSLKHSDLRPKLCKSPSRNHW